MGTKVPLSIQANNAVKIRTLTGTPVTADSASISDSNYDPTAAAQPQGYRAALIFLRFTGGTNPTAIVQLLHRIAQGPVTNGWAQGAMSVALQDGVAFFVDVMGRDFFPMIATVTGAPTEIDVWASGWESYRYDGPRGA